LISIHLLHYLSTPIPSYYTHLFALFLFFFFNDPPPTEIYTLSLHDALPISELDRELRRDSRRRAEHPRHRRRHRRDSLPRRQPGDRKSTRLNSSHDQISYAVFCLKKKKKQ